MPRYKLTVEYDGTPFSGWQKQEGELTVQGVLEAACASFIAQPVETICAGRTDAGVHALGQVAQVDFPQARDPALIIRGLNTLMLPHPVVVVKAEAVGDDFNARTGAMMRHYEYRIVNRPARLSLDALRAWYIRRPLDIAAMREGAAHLIGHHDFSTFRDSKCQAAHAMRTMGKIDIAQDGENIFIRISSKSFLHRQVRNIVGTLALVGHGKWSPMDVKKALEAKDRRAGGPTAPAHGLYFMRVDY